jgi:hypothetical protein
MVVFAVPSTITVATGDDVVVDVEEIALPPVERAPDDVRLARDRYFGAINLLDAFASPNQLDTLLKQKLALVDKVCQLTDAQKHKVELAGRGDNKRLTDRIQRINAQFELVKNDAAKIDELRTKAQLLESGITSPGGSSDGSLVTKVLEQLLTAEQAVKYEPLRTVFRAGGLVRMWEIGRHDEGLAVNLTGTAIGDEDLSRLSELPSLKSLDLDGTRITDIGLARLKRIYGLRKVSLARTSVTATGVAELRHALFDLTIEK